MINCALYKVYTLGKLKIEAVADNHGGGYYFYATPEEATRAEVPDSRAMFNAKRVIVRYDISGKELAYGNKLAASYIKPIEIVACVL